MDTPIADAVYADLESFILGAPIATTARVTHGLLLKRFKRAEFSDAEFFWAWPLSAIKMHCHECRGERTFSNSFVEDVGDIPRHLTWLAMVFKCRDCQRFERGVTVKYRCDAPEPDESTCTEGYTTLPVILAIVSIFPGLTPAPSKGLKKLLGDFETQFRRGVACEAQGLGVGAFAYYRQIVEGLKDRLFDTLIRLVELEGGPDKDALIGSLREVKSAFQFKGAAEYAKNVLPESVKIAGHNPLGLLYEKLSIGIHSSNDEECLAAAKAIRTVLVALAERLAVALENEKALTAAVGSLHDSRKKK